MGSLPRGRRREPRQRKAIANYFIFCAEREGRRLTPAQLQHLTYVAHGLHLGEHGEPLVEEAFLATPAGQAAASLQSEPRGYGDGPVADYLYRFDPTLRAFSICLAGFNGDPSFEASFGRGGEFGLGSVRGDDR